ncbi:MAG: 30S ribosomal protein S21 [Bacteroidetes bacterium]|nr:MAG: 30S ribosomal protein S21 [Bacteroidota bacterium]
MLIISIKDNEAIDKALKRFKKKFEKTGVLKQLRSRSFFQKGSITKRQTRLRAAYKEKTYHTESNA